MDYKKLAEKFKKNGFEHEIIKRAGDIAIYKRYKNPKLPHYEVIKINRHDGYEIAGVWMEPAETYPGSNSWGALGWTYTTLGEAEKKFNQLK